ncbi:EAL domain-containing response regulator [Pelagibacterium luteolum]|uniref:EAL domain, c-di-GMP-specific phosphodiesterase class I (Or its enzymatically inactive variant) n=1 Tax=Pelagibacterium luteolum TaxID=440168 RepID=A0A1G7VFU5_9HYPH|nr:EAL domain-containing response regulator [Pelagibacterium luteolum]SDG58567.1 EAL domain, c-di-GMP-specific phosphodiesterase class I (or its enzymatically inactive variant) [Pelagibacterium luteolum]
MTDLRSEPLEHPLASGLRLLILDDDPLVGGTVRQMAASIGAESAYCGTAAEFFTQVADWSPSHILLDLVMPGVDGVEVIQRLGEISCQATLIIVSGVDRRVLDAAQRSAKQHRLSLAGALSKPFSRGALATLLETGNAKPKLQLIPASSKSSPSGDELANALAQGEIGPVFQPKVRCNDGSLIGYEALARWTRDETDICGPDTFVPLAERTGQAARLTEVIADRSLAWLGSHFAAQPHTIAINIPAQCLKDDHSVRAIAEACSRYNVAPERVVLEVTESGAIDPDSGALDVLTRARLMGMKLSIDDFGVGYSSLVQLARMPFSEIKIDRSFVAELCHSCEAQAIIAAIIGMSDGLGMTTVAEGVEDLDTYMRLREMGCYAAQGYFIGRPMRASRAVAWSEIG